MIGLQEASGKMYSLNGSSRTRMGLLTLFCILCMLVTPAGKHAREETLLVANLMHSDSDGEAPRF